VKWLKRIFGISATPLPENDDDWTFEDGSIRLQLAQMPEIRHPGSAVRLEGKGLPVRVLVVHGQDGRFHALANRCTHMGRRIDILPGTDRIECCSVSKSTYDYSGQPLGGAAKKPLQVFTATLSDTELTIKLG